MMDDMIVIIKVGFLVEKDKILRDDGWHDCYNKDN